MYSRRLTVEERKNKRKAIFFVLLTGVAIILMYFYGIPILVRFAGFAYDLRKSTESVDIADTTPPPPPHFEPIPPYTSDNKIELQGNSEPGASVILVFDSYEEELIAGSDGKFFYTHELVGGENTLQAYAKDSAGNQSQKTDSYTIVFDKEKPELKITKPQDGSEFYGSKQRQILIEGQTEKDVKIQINNKMVVVDLNGNFTFATTLQEGVNTFNINAQDPAGNITETSLNVKYSQ